jgi:WD40-like Beta Propeller Repeat
MTRRLQHSAALLLVAAASATPASGGVESFPGVEGRIAFAKLGAPTQIETMIQPDPTPAPLGRTPIFGFSPRWSPDGTELAFVSERDGNAEIYTVSANGLDEERLTRDAVPDLRPNWTEDGVEIVFQRGTGAAAEIYSVDVLSRAVRRLTRNREADSDPAAAPNAPVLAFGRHGDLYKMTLEGRRLARLTRGRPVDSQPAWSPTGTRIVFVRASGSDTDLYTVGAGGRGLRRLTATRNRSESSPTWSPAGDKILFRACTAVATCQLYVIGADGTGERPLAGGAGIDGEDPDWQALPARRSWDADDDFLFAPNNRNPSPDPWGDTSWSYLYSDGFAHDPATYHLLPEYVSSDSNRQSWVLPDYVNLLVSGVRSPEALVLHPWGGRVAGVGRDAVLAWRSPIDGQVTVTGSVQLPGLGECALGSGAIWSVDKGATVLQGGALPTAGSATFDVPVSVSRGESVYFVWDAGWDSLCDSGLLDLDITQ